MITTEQLQRIEAVAGDVVRAARWPTPGVLMNRERVESYLSQHGHVWAPRDADAVFRQARHIIEKIAATPTERATALARLDVMMGDEKPLDGTDVRTRDTEPPDREDGLQFATKGERIDHDPYHIAHRLAEYALALETAGDARATNDAAAQELHTLASVMRECGEQLLALAPELTR